MRATTIRFLDYWLGIPACGFLTLIRGLGSAFAKDSADRAQPRRILFLKFIEQGATVLAHDAIRLAVREVGRDNVFFCVFESNRAILDVLETVPARNILSIRDRALAAFLADFLRAAWYVRSHQIDSVIDMEFFSRASAIFAFLTGASNRVGLHRFTGELPYRGDLMTHRVQYLPQLHIAVQYLILVSALFRRHDDEPLLKVPLDDIRADGVGEPPRFVPRPAELERMRTRVGLSPVAVAKGDGATARPIVILNPNASDLLPLRKWPTERFQALGQRVLAAYPNALVVITGAPSERVAAEALCRGLGSPRVVSVAGETSLPELLTLYSLADVLVTNDSGPGHFASLTPVHAVVLFGPETPRLFGPLASSTVIWKELACSPCVSVFNHRLSPCTNNVCMQAITVDEVFEAVQASIRLKADSTAETGGVRR
jgi:ADP-heptose:LPS heptosyltransferase